MDDPEASRAGGASFPTAGPGDHVTVSIVSHDQGALVQRLLDDFARLRPARASRFVITRNVPEDWTPPQRVGEAPVVVIDNALARGFGANHNTALGQCDTPFFAVLNPDLRVPSDPFVILRLFNQRGIVMAAPRIIDPSGHDEDFARRLVTPLDLFRRRIGKRRPSPDPAWLAGMFLVVRTTELRSLHGFDERYFMYCEDVDLCARIRLAGYDFGIDHDVVVVHDARRDSHRSVMHLRWHLASLLRWWSSGTFWRYRRLLAEGGT